MIKNRLQSPYMNSTYKVQAYQKEMNNRLSILKAMADFWSSEKDLKYISAVQLKKFFLDVARNKDENIVIRRQAYKNLITFENYKDMVDQKRKIASNSKLLHLVSFSDESMIESLANNEN